VTMISNPMPAVLALDQPFGVIFILLALWLYAWDQNLNSCRGLVWSVWVCRLSGINVYRCVGGPVIFAAL